MRRLLVEFVSRNYVATRADCLRLVQPHVLNNAITDGVLTRVFPRTYTLPHLVDDVATRRLAALTYLPDSALSHLDALDLWQLLPVDGLARSDIDRRVHLTRPAGVPATCQPDLEVHRRKGFDPRAECVTRTGPVGDLRVVRLEQAIVDSWSLLAPMEQRVPALVAIRERRTTASRLLRALNATPRAPGRDEMARVFQLVGGGCHSPLEIWGHERVFSDPRLPMSVRQHPIELPSGVVYLDRYFDEEQVAVELDGAAYHGAPRQRERDIRRDGSVAKRGIQTLRFSHPRLFNEPESVILETLEVLAVRRTQLGLPPR